MTGRSARPVDLALVIVVAGCFVMAVGRAALTWDGSYYLLAAQRSPAVPIFFARYTQAFLLAPAWLGSRLAGATLGMAVFAATYALVPALALLVCRLLVRGDPTVMVWPLLSTLVTLPGQLFLVSEATILAQVSWPLLFAIRARRPGISICIGLVALGLHPVAFLILGLAAVYSWSQGLRVVSVAFTLLAALAKFRPLAPVERESTHLRIVLLHAHASVGAVPVLLVLTAYLVAVAQRVPAPVVAGLMSLVGGVGVMWVMQPSRWATQLDYRTVVVPAMVPLLILAALRGTWRAPAATGVGAAILFFAVISVQTYQWQHLLADARSNGPCMQIRYGSGTALDHWATPSLTRVLARRCGPGPVPAPQVAGMPRISG